jgi:hypothetical protein
MANACVVAHALEVLDKFRAVPAQQRPINAALAFRVGKQRLEAFVEQDIGPRVWVASGRVRAAKGLVHDLASGLFEAVLAHTVDVRLQTHVRPLALHRLPPQLPQSPNFSLVTGDVRQIGPW